MLMTLNQKDKAMSTWQKQEQATYKYFYYLYALMLNPTKEAEDYVYQFICLQEMNQ